MSWPAVARTAPCHTTTGEGWECIRVGVSTVWLLTRTTPLRSSRTRSLEMLVLPSERGFQPPAPPGLSTLAKVITATCPTRVWEVLTAVMIHECT